MLNSGEVLNARYRVERVLGQGGMGAVYLATHLQLQEQVAIKEMRVLTNEPSVRELLETQFRAEARILNRLRHPNLPRVYDFFDTEGRHYLVMDYIRGGTLDGLMARAGGGLPESQVLTWIPPLCDVLGYLHSYHPPVIFRDLKPANIMLTAEGEIRLIDFGIAKVFEPEQGASTKTVMRGAASHGFAAPEQYGAGGTDARSDIYSLGATLYTLLTGHVPPPAMELAAGIATLVPMREYCPSLSDSIVAAVEWMLQVRREMRPPTVQAVRESLGMATQPGLVQPAPSLPHQMRQVLREEFHHFFPLKNWIDRGDVLKTVLARLRAGGERVPFMALVGEPGLGKSRLLREVADQVGEEYEILPVMHASPAARQQPFSVLLPAMGAWMRSNPSVFDLLSTRLEAQELHEAATLLPELKSKIADLPPAAQRGPLERARSIMDALTVILDHAAGDRPVLLLLDDMHWVDDTTLRFLDALHSGTMARRVAMILVVDAVGADHPCKEFIERWTRKGEMSPVTLPPLRKDEVRGYVEAALPPIQGLEQKVDLLWERSHGNPLLLEELLRFMVVRRFIADRGGTLAVTEFRPDILPNTLEDAFRRRREHLPLDTQMLLGQASASGTRFDVRTLLKLTGESTSSLGEALQRACETLFVQPEDRGVYCFAAEAARQVFYQSLTSSQRVTFHRKLGTIEEERASRSGETAQTAWHYQQAGDVDKSIQRITELSQELLQPKTLEVVVGDAMRFKEFKATRQLSPEQVEQGLLALNMLLRSMKSLAVYGANSPITTTSFGTALSVISKLVKDNGTLGYTLSEEAFHVNLNEVPMSHVPNEFKGHLARHRISGFEFQPGVEERDLTDFLDLLISSRETVQGLGGWVNACASRNVHHVVVNEIVYVGVAEKDLFDISKMKLVEDVVVKDKPSERWTSDTHVRTGLAGIDAVLASVASTAGSPELLGGQLQKLRELLEELKQEARPAAPAVPNRAHLDPGLETSLTDLLRQSRADELKRVVALSQSVDVPLKTFLESRPEVLLELLEQDDVDKRTLGAMGLLKLGKDARRWLVQYLRTSEHPIGRAAAVFLFIRIEADASLSMAREVLSCASAEETGRLLRAMQTGNLDWAAPLANLLFSPLADFRRAALQTLVDSNIPVYTRLEFLQHALQSESVPVLEDTVRFVGELRAPQAIPHLILLMEKLFIRRTPDVIRLQEQICHALGRIGSAEALPLLKSIIVRRGFLVGAWESPVRAAAVFALAQIDHPEAEELLKKQAQDGDANVSGTAKYVLSRRHAPPASRTEDEDILEAWASDKA